MLVAGPSEASIPATFQCGNLTPLDHKPGDTPYVAMLCAPTHIGKYTLISIITKYGVLLCVYIALALKNLEGSS